MAQEWGKHSPAVDASAFTTTREHLQRTAAVKKPLKPVPGVYNIDFEGLKGSFTVEEVAVPPDSSLPSKG